MDFADGRLVAEIDGPVSEELAFEEDLDAERLFLGTDERFADADVSDERVVAGRGRSEEDRGARAFDPRAGGVHRAPMAVLIMRIAGGGSEVRDMAGLRGDGREIR